MCIDDTLVEEFNNCPARCDGRVLPRKSNNLGTPEMPLGDVVAASKEFDWGGRSRAPGRLDGA